MVRHGQGGLLLQKMQETKLKEQHAPLYHALRAVMEGEDHLLSINPETRAPAQQLFLGLQRMVKLFAHEKAARS
jgi:hypothetical protein